MKGHTKAKDMSSQRLVDEPRAGSSVDFEHDWTHGKLTRSISFVVGWRNRTPVSDSEAERLE